VKLLSPIRAWLLLALFYTAATLAWWNSHVKRTAPPPPRTAFVLPADAPRLKASVSRDTPRQAVFTLALPAAELEKTGQIRFFLAPDRNLPGFTVQVIAEGDHHYSFSHLYRLPRLPQSGYSFTVPFLGDDLYWKTLGHTGAWTPWERGGLRRFEIKLFSAVPLTARTLDLRYQTDPAPAVPTLVWRRASADSLPLGERFEFDFDLAGWNGNPFLYNQLPVQFEVQGPDGKALRPLPFLYQDFIAESALEGERIRPSGPKHFRVRVRPLAPGPHTYRLVLQPPGGSPRVLAEGRFTVTPGSPPGFLRVSDRSPRFFERADGRFVYLLGWNLPYPVDRPYGNDYVPYLPSDSGLATTRKLLDDVADSGGNFIRYWLSDWWNGLEWHASVDNYGGLARYNLKNAWLNDRVVAHCEKRGIYMQWETLNHVRLNENYGWPRHPYNRANGGFLDYPQDFWVNPETRPWSENRLAYIIARYADSPAIHSWNLMSEPDLVSKGVWPSAKAFILSQTAFVAALDPYGHITSSHLCMPDHDIAFFLNPRLQFVNNNAYPGLGGLGEDQIQTIRDFSTRYGGHGKPMLVAECAGHWAGDPAYKMQRDTLGALWAGLASNLAGSPLSWWWNFNYGDSMGRFYRIAADFMAGEDLIAAEGAGGPWLNRETRVESRDGNARALMVGNSNRRFLFLYNYDTLSRTRLIPSLCTDTRVTLDGLAPGDYRADFWDLRKGRADAEQDVTAAADGTARLSPPAFTEGWAVKLVPRAEPRAPTPPRPPPAAARQPPASAILGTAGDWSWRLEPLAGVVHPAAGERALAEVRLALPDACRGLYPRLTAESGAAVPFAWEPLDGGAGWLLRIPAAGLAGPVRVTPSEEKPDALPRLDEETLGLKVTVTPGRSPWLAEREQFTDCLKQYTVRKSARVPAIDYLENPLGPTEHFLAVYEGPLLAPADGVYEIASNSDDASFVSIDGREIVAWPGQHDMEVRDRPNENYWRHRARIELKKGLHWVEYDHQQRSGGCLARLGWRLPESASGKDAWPFIPFPDFKRTRTTVVPEWAFDGRIPCRVQVEYKGKAQARLEPCFGLELRRPVKRLYALALDKGGEREFRFTPTEGRQVIEVDGQNVPVWAWNDHWRRFSLEWQACVDSRKMPALKLMLYDIDLPVKVAFGKGPAIEKNVARRTWTAWLRPAAEGPVPFTLSLGPIPLVQGELEALPSGGSVLAEGKP
jgi:hypothetical protein